MTSITYIRNACWTWVSSFIHKKGGGGTLNTVSLITPPVPAGPDPRPPLPVLVAVLRDVTVAAQGARHARDVGVWVLLLRLRLRLRKRCCEGCEGGGEEEGEGKHF